MLIVGVGTRVRHDSTAEAGIKESEMPSFFLSLASSSYPGPCLKRKQAKRLGKGEPGGETENEKRKKKKKSAKERETERCAGIHWKEQQQQSSMLSLACDAFPFVFRFFSVVPC